MENRTNDEVALLMDAVIALKHPMPDCGCNRRGVLEQRNRQKLIYANLINGLEYAEKIATLKKIEQDLLAKKR